jgi:hypothetical protein
MTRAQDLLDRLADKILVGDGCWLWTASTYRNGYGVFRYDNEHYAHRVLYKLMVGPIPSGASVLHHCDTPSCVRPDHLFLGTQADNIADMDSKGRRGLGGFALQAKSRTHCKNGHPFDKENTHIASTGQRTCRACGRAKYWRRKARSTVAI